MDKLIRGKYVIADPGTDLRVGEDIAVLVRGGKIAEVGPYTNLAGGLRSRPLESEAFDLVMPGLINAHHHGRFPPPMLLGCVDETLEPWLLSLRRIGYPDPRLAVQLSSARQLAGGVTTLIHSDGPTSGDTYESLVRERIEGYKATGQRVAFAVGYADQDHWVYGRDEDFLEELPVGLREEAWEYSHQSPVFSPRDYDEMFRRLDRWVRADSGELIRLFLGPLSPIWCSESALAAMAHLLSAGEYGLHSHLLESIHQRNGREGSSESRKVERLMEMGLLGNRTSYAHAVWVTRRDMSYLAEGGATVVHCPSSNLRLRCGIAPILRMLAVGVKIALGIDANGLDDDDDLFREVRLAKCLHFEPGMRQRALELEDVFRAVYSGGARAALLEGQVGALKPGWQADIIGISLDRASSGLILDSSELFPAILQRLRGDDVRWVMVGGKEVVRDGRPTLVDLVSLQEELSERIAQGFGRAAGHAGLLERLKPYVVKYYERQNPELGRPLCGYNGDLVPDGA